MIYHLNKNLILASGSPRRKQLLSECGFSFEVVVSDIDETVLDNESPAELVSRLAISKTQAVANKFPEHYVLGADTDVALDGRIFGKPANKEEAIDMLSGLSGSTHQVLGAIALINIESSLQLSCISVTEVTFRDLSKREIIAYAETSEPYDKAGSYAAQELGASFIKAINGSYTNVVGLDLAATINLFRQAKILEF